MAGASCRDGVRVVAILIDGQELRDPPNEINANGEVYALAFSANGEYLLGGVLEGVRVWRVKDGEQVAMIEVPQTEEARQMEELCQREPTAEWIYCDRTVYCLAVSKDGRRIAGGTSDRRVFVWDAETYETVFSHTTNSTVNLVDFSYAHSTRLLVGASQEITIWDISRRERVVGPIRHRSNMTAAKLSPRGDRFAVAISHFNSVRVYDGYDGRLLVDITITISSWPDSLLWFDDHLILACGNKIKQLDASTGSEISEWPVPGEISESFISVPKNQTFVALACFAERTVMFWDVSTHTLLCHIQFDRDIYLMPLSLDGRVIAFAGRSKNSEKIVLKRLSSIVEPYIQIDEATLSSWQRDRVVDMEAFQTALIPTSQHPSHQALASQAFFRARLRQWDAAIDDANESIKIRPSVIGYIAKSMALVGAGEKLKAYRACDIAFERFRSQNVGFLLLTKAIIAFIAGDHDDALSRINDLIDTLHFNSICYVVQAYMHLLLGNACMECHDYKGAIRSFTRARDQIRPHTSRALLIVSLISGWDFDNLAIAIRKQLCEALYAAGCTKDASEVVLETVNAFSEEIYKSEGVVKWVSDFTRRCLANPGCDGDASSQAAKDDDRLAVHSTINSATPSPLLREWARVNLMITPWEDVLITTAGFTEQRYMIYRAICERLETIDHIGDASRCFLQMMDELLGRIAACGEPAKWTTAFGQRCAEKLEILGDIAAGAQQYDDAITQYSAVLSLNLPTPHVFVKRSKVYIAMGLWKDALNDVNLVISHDPLSPWGYERVFQEWAMVNLTNGLWVGALSAARDFLVPRLTVYRFLCEALEAAGGMMEALECYHKMASGFPDQTVEHAPEAEWVLPFRHRCSEKLEHLGDAAMDSQQLDEVIVHYSAALSIHPTNIQSFFILRSKLCVAKGLSLDALSDAIRAIILDPSSPWGYEAKHAALHAAGRYREAVQAFEVMLTKMEQSSDPQIRERRSQYVDPSDTRTVIRRVIQRTLRHFPRVLIHTTTGRLQNKDQQTAAFMSLPIVDKLVASMTTNIDRSRIKREVKLFFRYVMLSHRWEENEPLFQLIMRTTVYGLGSSPTHDKLQTFCKTVRDAGFTWAWSDTCCINKDDHFVLQEALVAMFEWYRHSAMMIVFLRGVGSLAKFGELVRSIWNTRAWTLQEYVAAKVIRFYTEDWTPYLSIDTFNHKQSPEIILEMEQATGVTAQQLTMIRPGLSSIREKLRLASTRHTTLVEDAAYSLLGIFSVSGISAIYGEGENALGRMLSHILSGSGDASILAWTGQSGGYNTCLPAHISVFTQSASLYLPSVEDVEMEHTIATMRTSTLDLDSAMKLYDRLNDLPSPWFAASRMKLPCIAFKLPPLTPHRTHAGRIYRADTSAFGMVEIKTRHDPSRSNTLYLVHPWIDALLDREDTRSDAVAEDDIPEPALPGMDDDDLSDEDAEDDAAPAVRASPSPGPPSHMRAAPMDRGTRAMRLLAHLRRPFGALLLSLTATRRRAVVYRRVAADCLITVQLRESVPLGEVLEGVRILDVL